ncbi:MAG TPA: Ada metal-binding domain-containing protein [Cyclobacteriaceae bacterium]
MIYHSTLTPGELRKQIRSGHLKFAGNVSLKIYGLFDCSSGKRMKHSNRVFFATEQSAINNGFRPCSHCMPDDYRRWKSSQETG